MNTHRARRAAASLLLASGAVLLLPAAAHADTCMTDDKGNQVCGMSGTGPTTGPGSNTGNTGIHDGTAGMIGPDGKPLAAAPPAPWTVPGYVPPAAPRPAPNPGGPANYVAPPPVTAPTYIPPAPAVERPPADGSTGSGAGESDAGSGSSGGATVSPAPSPTAPGAATPAPTMTEMARHTPAPTKTAPAAVASTPASETTPFDPVPLLAIIGAIVGAAAVIWFVPGIRAAVTGLFGRGGH